MLFNAPEFVLFLPIVFAGYWTITTWFSDRATIRNLVLLVASYVFYGWWDPRFLILIIASSAIDFIIGLRLQRLPSLADGGSNIQRRLLLIASLIANLGMLGIFKYYNFFAESLAASAAQIGWDIQPATLDWILPVGISFYTFQTLSYTIDIYLGRLHACRNPVTFFTFVAFFPQLVAGPIERASHLLPQFSTSKRFTYEDGKDGMRRILWGMFKKVVVADGCGDMANSIFANHQDLSGSVHLMGAVYFAFQIYGDFSGYSDIAIGTARLFGIQLMENFKLPYFSRDPAEFWRRWHVSLSSWFRDYVYIPLGGSRISKWVTVRNTAIVFLVSGLWHGANWTFVAWGLLHWIYFLPQLLLGSNRRNVNSVPGEGNWLELGRDIMAMVTTFGLITIAWVFFRSPSIAFAVDYLAGIFQPTLFEFPNKYRSAITPVIFLLIAEWLTRHHRYPLDFDRVPMPVRWFVYVVLATLCLSCYRGSTEFIYFQF